MSTKEIQQCLANLEDAAFGYVAGAPSDVVEQARKSAEKLRALPATHRIVPVELLERVLRALPNESVPWLCTKLQAIIDKEPT